LWEHPEPAADLIYEELCLRQEHGPEVPVGQVLDRFPQWRPQLEGLFDRPRVLGPRRAPPQFPRAAETLGDLVPLSQLGRGARDSSSSMRWTACRRTPGNARSPMPGAPPGGSWLGRRMSRRFAGSAPAWPTPSSTRTSVAWFTWTSSPPTCSWRRTASRCCS